MDPDKAKKLLELSARYAPAVKAAEARRGAASYHALGDKRTETSTGETVHLSGEQGRMDP